MSECCSLLYSFLIPPYSYSFFPVIFLILLPPFDLSLFLFLCPPSSTLQAVFGTINGYIRWQLAGTVMHGIYNGHKTSNNGYIFKVSFSYS